jgi:hypothetical protein
MKVHNEEELMAAIKETKSLSRIPVFIRTSKNQLNKDGLV